MGQRCFRPTHRQSWVLREAARDDPVQDFHQSHYQEADRQPETEDKKASRPRALRMRPYAACHWLTASLPISPRSLRSSTLVTGALPGSIIELRLAVVAFVGVAPDEALPQIAPARSDDSVTTASAFRTEDFGFGFQDDGHAAPFLASSSRCVPATDRRSLFERTTSRIGRPVATIGWR